MSDLNASSTTVDGEKVEHAEHVNALLAGIDPDMIDNGQQIAEFLGMDDSTTAEAAPSSTAAASGTAAPATTPAAGDVSAAPGNTIEADDQNREAAPDVQADDGEPAKVKQTVVLTKGGYELPKRVKALYVAVDGKFVDRKSEEVSFEDKGSKLHTKAEDRKTIENMVAVAEAKGWTTVHLKGTEEFRRQAWIAAQVAGLEVHGYKPNEQDHAAVQARREEMRIAAGEKASQPARDNAIEAGADRDISEPREQSKRVDVAPVSATAAKAPAAPALDTTKPAAQDGERKQYMSPDELKALRAELATDRARVSELDRNELIEKYKDPAFRASQARDLLRSVGRNPDEFYDEKGVKPIDQQGRSDRDAANDAASETRRETAQGQAARMVLEHEMRTAGLPEADRQVLRDQLNAAISDAAVKGVELQIPEPMVADRAPAVEHAPAQSITQTHTNPTQDVDR